MENYIGVKEIKAQPMNRKEYNDYRGWEVPEDENPNDKGFLVEYLDGGQSNHPSHEGYVSWSPKDVFERAYRKTSGMTFGLAIEAMKKGHRVARKGWNGKNMWLILVDKDEYEIEAYKYFNANDRIGFIAMKTADNKIVPWLASQTDMLSEDWVIVK